MSPKEIDDHKTSTSLPKQAILKETLLLPFNNVHCIYRLIYMHRLDKFTLTVMKRAYSPNSPNWVLLKSSSNEITSEKKRYKIPKKLYQNTIKWCHEFLIRCQALYKKVETPQNDIKSTEKDIKRAENCQNAETMFKQLKTISR